MAEIISNVNSAEIHHWQTQESLFNDDSDSESLFEAFEYRQYSRPYYHNYSTPKDLICNMPEDQPSSANDECEDFCGAGYSWSDQQTNNNNRLVWKETFRINNKGEILKDQDFWNDSELLDATLKNYMKITYKPNDDAVTEPYITGKIAELKHFASAAGWCAVRIEDKAGNEKIFGGSGVFIEDEYFLTCYHVLMKPKKDSEPRSSVDPGSRFSVDPELDKTKIEAGSSESVPNAKITWKLKVIGVDKYSDLAICKIQTDETRSMRMPVSVKLQDLKSLELLPRLNAKSELEKSQISTFVIAYAACKSPVIREKHKEILARLRKELAEHIDGEKSEKTKKSERIWKQAEGDTVVLHALNHAGWLINNGHEKCAKAIIDNVSTYGTSQVSLNANTSVTSHLDTSKSITPNNELCQLDNVWT